jgi:multidrug efflux system membrane fusion protein
MPRLLAVALPLLAASAATVGCKRDAAPAGFAFPPALVTTAPAVAQDVPVYLDEIGRVVASDVVALKARVSGTIAKVDFPDGANVAEGKPLFEIDPAPYAAKAAEAAAKLAFAEAGAKEARASRATAEARVATAQSRVGEARARRAAAAATAAQAKSETTAAEADAERAAADERRYADASASGAISKMDIDRAKAESNAAAARLAAARRKQAAAEAQTAEAEAAVKTADDGVHEATALLSETDARIASADANVSLARAALETARIEVGWCTIPAPMSGRAGRRLVDVGNVVKADDTVLVVIQRLDPVHVEFSIPERDLSAVQENMNRGPLTAQVSLPDAAASDGAAAPAAAEPARPGTLSFLNNTVEAQTGTVALRATVRNADERFWPGRFARVRLVLRTLPKAVLVPATAPHNSATGTVVFVAKPDGTVDMRAARIGQRQGDLVVVESGVQAGEQVVTTGQQNLQGGAKYRLPPPPPPAGPAPAAGKAP